MLMVIRSAVLVSLACFAWYAHAHHLTAGAAYHALVSR